MTLDSSSSRQNPGEAAVASCQLASEKLQTASKCLCKFSTQHDSIQERNQNQQGSSSSFAAIAPKFQIIENNDLHGLVRINELCTAKSEFPTPAVCSLQSDGPHQFALILIRQVLCQEEDGVEPESESGIILYNYGVACFLYLTMSQAGKEALSFKAPPQKPGVHNTLFRNRDANHRDDDNNKTYSIAYHMMISSYTAFTKKMTSMLKGGSSEEEDMEQTIALCLMITMTLSAAGTFLEQCRNESSEECRAATLEIRRKLHFMREDAKKSLILIMYQDEHRGLFVNASPSA